tara:strand:+ start:3065 stop:3937 length:873 start_codon:yes stop_codon:yes gene_type:complete
MIQNIIFIIKIILRRISGPIVRGSIEKNHNTLCVIGNGPSLKKDLLLIKKNIDDYDVVSVNQFSTYKEYSIIKPKHYVLVDSIYWDGSLNEDIVANTSNAITSIITKTNWPLNLYVPLSKKLYFQKIFTKNPFINLCTIKTGGKLLKNTNVMKVILKYRLSFLPTINVVHLAIQIGFFLRYKKIIAFGLDSDSFKSLYVDQFSNLVYSNPDHYNSSKSLKKMPIQKKHKSLSQRLDQASLSFKIYEVLNIQAKFENLKLLNCSSFSMIDSLDRDSLFHEKNKNNSYKSYK